VVFQEIDPAVSRDYLKKKRIRPIAALQNLPHFQPLPLPGEVQGAFMEAGAGIGGYLGAH
jgi:hypothetical protein